MADPVNLRLARKRREREEKDRLAAENRRRFGRNGAEKAAARRETARAGRHLDEHRRDHPHSAE